MNPGERNEQFIPALSRPTNQPTNHRYYRKFSRRAIEDSLFFVSVFFVH